MNSEHPSLSRIRIYPIKSLDPVELGQVEIGTLSLLHDREFAFLTPDGRFINGKRTGRVNELKAEYDLVNHKVHLSPRSGGPTSTFDFTSDQKKIESYVGDFFGEPVSLVQNKSGKLMDIPEVASVTVVSTASLQSLQDDLQCETLENLRLRFRVNLEIDGVEAFWEESLIGNPGTGIRFAIGEVEMIGVSPRARCNVPPRDPNTGVPDKSFVRKMMQSRGKSLPDKSLLPAYGSLYQLTINTYLPESEAHKWLRVGDPIKVLGPIELSS